ncbi:hypothetical protein N3356_002845 [Micrococcus luteus]|nr:hypothetical protein [Micrococcus luteus]
MEEDDRWPRSADPDAKRDVVGDVDPGEREAVEEHVAILPNPGALCADRHVMPD